MNLSAAWGRGPDFAEAAEALELRTDQVMAMLQEDGKVLVVYTPVEGTVLWRVLLERDADGILRKASDAVEVPGLWEEIQAHVERHLGAP